MTMYYTAAVTANRLGISKTYLLIKANEGLVMPRPIKVHGKVNSPWLFSPNARVIKKTVDKQKNKVVESQPV